jgi:hypothetical protein
MLLLFVDIQVSIDSITAILRDRVMGCIENMEIMPELDIFSRCALFDEIRRNCIVLRPQMMLSEYE